MAAAEAAVRHRAEVWATYRELCAAAAQWTRAPLLDAHGRATLDIADIDATVAALTERTDMLAAALPVRSAKLSMCTFSVRVVAPRALVFHPQRRLLSRSQNTIIACEHGPTHTPCIKCQAQDLGHGVEHRPGHLRHVQGDALVEQAADILAEVADARPALAAVAAPALRPRHWLALLAALNATAQFCPEAARAKPGRPVKPEVCVVPCPF